MLAATLLFLDPPRLSPDRVGSDLKRRRKRVVDRHFDNRGRIPVTISVAQDLRFQVYFRRQEFRICAVGEL
jgi:hypothetical protein